MTSKDKESPSLANLSQKLKQSELMRLARVKEARKRNGFEKRRTSNRSSTLFEPLSGTSLAQPASGEPFKQHYNPIKGISLRRKVNFARIINRD